MMQLVASALPVAYPSNLAAMFWQAPCYGVALHQKLFQREMEQSFNSRYGITEGPQGPHEFGRFWRTLLNYPDMQQRAGHSVDWQRVRDTLANMTETADSAFAFKSFLPVWHLDDLSRTCIKSIFVHIKRDPLENALSLLKARRAYAERETDWVGLKPLACKPHENASIAKQVVSQVIEINRVIEKQLEMIPEDRVIRTPLRQLCAEPETYVSKIATCINGVQETQVKSNGRVPALKENFPSYAADPAEIDAIKAAFAHFDYAL